MAPTVFGSSSKRENNTASGGTVNVSEARKELLREFDANVYWNQFDTSKHHFFKIMTMNNFRTELRIPKKFVTNSPLELKETVELVGPTKDVWGVRVVKTGDDVLFEQGWGQFVTDHHLNKYDLLVFHYIGDFAFEVWIFDPSGCQKDLRLIDNRLEIKPHFFKVMNMEFRSKLVIPVMLVKTFPDKIVEKVTLKGPSGNVWEVGSKRIGAEMFLLEGWDEFVSDHDVDEKSFLIFHYTGNSSFTVLIFEKNGCEKESAHFVEPRVKSAPPPRKERNEKGKGKGKRPEGCTCTGGEDMEMISNGNKKMKGKMGV
ncbi:hypothetical protein QQ045_008635 [Rhodiola kirilowii]